MSQSGLMLAFAIPTVLPLLLVAWLGWYPQSKFISLAPWLAVPALTLLVLPVGTTVDYPWLLLGLQLGIDTTNRTFLALTAILWLVSSIYARSYMRDDRRYVRYWVFHLLTMAGNFGLVLAQDVVSFYAGFVLMSLAAFGLVVHTGSRIAYQAGLLYLVMAVAGELMLFAGIVLAASAADSVLLVDIQAVAPHNLTVLLLVTGFGIKAGLLGVHIWLPLAHPVAPTPASAVLSGVMIKAGLLGWLRFLPLGIFTLPGWGTALLGLGLAGAYFGVLRGLPETNPKKILAYSSISQMGLMTSIIGLGLWVPEFWPALFAAVLLYALHHALTKGALFLGVGVCASTAAGSRRGRWVWAAMALLAGALAGLPFTSGSTAKYALKQAVQSLEPLATAVLTGLLSIAAVGTTLLMLRLLSQLQFSSQRIARPAPGLWLTWGSVLLMVIVLAALHPLVSSTLAPAALWAALWPIGLALGLWWIAQRPAARRRLLALHAAIRWQVRRGYTRSWALVHYIQNHLTTWQRPSFDGLRVLVIDWRRRSFRSSIRAEYYLTRWPVFGLIFMVLALLMFVVSV